MGKHKSEAGWVIASWDTDTEARLQKQMVYLGSDARKFGWGSGKRDRREGSQ